MVLFKLMNETNIFSTASHKLFGPVKRISSKTYYTDSVGLPVRTCFQMFIRDFLPEAVIVFSRFTELNGLDSSCYKFEYSNDFRNIIQIFVNSTYDMRYLYKLDEKLRVIEKVLMSGNKCAEREVTFYNDEHRNKSFIKYNATGREEERIESYYNKDNKLTDMQITKRNEGISNYKITYIEPDIKVTKISDRNNKILKFRSETLDKYGNLLKQSESEPEGVNLFTASYQYTYTADNLIYEMICFGQAGKLNFRRIFLYDNHKNIVTEKTYVPARTEGEILSKIIENEIEYYMH